MDITQLASAEKEQLRKDIEDSLKLLRSQEWKEYVKALKVRQVRLQNKINAAVRSGDIVDAQINLALMDNCDQQVGLFRKYVIDTNSKLRKEKEKDNG